MFRLVGFLRAASPKMSFDELKFLREISEQELCELVLLPLLAGIGYREIRYTHGMLEFGKDIICSRTDPLEGLQYIGFTVKSQTLDGTVSSSRSIREIHYQVSQALKTPFISPVDGREITLSHVFVVTPYSISQHAARSIQDELHSSANAVTFIDGPRLRDLLNEHAPTLLLSLPDPKRRYILGVFNKYAEVQIISSLGALRRFTLPEIYTAGRLSPVSVEEARYISFARPRTGSGIAPNVLLSTHKFCVIVADVGAGKTTCLRKIALDLITSPDGEVNYLPAVTPVLVELSTLPEGTRTSSDIRAWLLAQVPAREDNDERAKECESYILLLDGFDELPGYHHEVAEAVEELSDSFPSGILVTTRPSRIPVLKDLFSYFAIEPFQDADIQAFLSTWFGQDYERAGKILQHIRTDTNLLTFCRTPLLLTLFTILASSETVGLLPRRRTDIYEGITALLLGRWDEIRSITNYFPAGVKAFVLEKIAHQMHRRKTKECSPGELLHLVESVIGNPRTPEGHATRLLVDELLYRSSLVRMKSGDSIEFSHLSFQEYFTARQLVRMADIVAISKVMFDEWWRNVIMFYFGTQRTMDGLWLSPKKAVGKAHFVAEYLLEADLTSKAGREAMVTAIGREFLDSNSPPAALLDVCLRMEYEIIPIFLRLLTSGTALSHEVGNFFSFLVALGRRGAKVAVEHAHLLEGLKLESLEVLLNGVVTLCRSREWFELFAVAYEYWVEAIYRGVSKAEPYVRIEIINSAKGTSKQLRNALSDTPGLDRKILARVRSRFREFEHFVSRT